MRINKLRFILINVLNYEVLKNKMTNAISMDVNGFKTIMDRYANDSPTRSEPKYIEFAVGDITPEITRTALDYPIMKSPTLIDACDADTGWTHAGDGDAETVNTTAGERREGTGCLNLPATYSAGTAYWSKNISSINVTSKYVYVYVFISTAAYALLVNAADCIKVGLGTGGIVNIDYWNWAKTDLTANAWNLLIIKDTATPDSDGGTGATISGIDYVYLSYQCTASITTNNIRMDWWHYGATTQLDVALASGYPIVNYDDQKTVFRGRLGSTEGNNNVITNMGLFNEDSPQLLQCEGQFDDITKSSKIILVAQPTIQFQ